MKAAQLGLSETEVQERQKAGLVNVTTAKAGKSVGKIIAGNVFTYFNLVFAVISGLLVLAGSSLRNFSFLPVVVANALIGIVQELRAKRVLDKLQVLHTPVARAIRGGEVVKVAVTKLVKDDVIVLKAGDQIPADARVVSGEVAVNEALLTGEADEITKKAGEELMSGSFVVYGECYARLEKVGDEAYAAQLTLRARAMKTGEESKIIAGLNKFVWMAGVAIVPIGAVMVGQQMAKGAELGVAMEAMVAAVIGMIPEGLFLLASVTLVLSAMRLAGKKVLLHDMKSIETLARADVLCVDKTGTITSGKMTVKEVVWLGGEAERGRHGIGLGEAHEADLRKEPEKAQEMASRGEAERALRAMVGALAADSETMVALKAKFGGKREPEWVPERVQGFSSRLKDSRVEFQGKGMFVLGAPEMVLREGRGEVRERIEQFSKRGLRVLVLAKYRGKWTTERLTEEAVPLAFLVLQDEIRESAKATFRYFREQGVEIKVISGDAPLTVAAVAEQAGIDGAREWVDLSERLSDEELAEAAKRCTVFGRVTPEDKRRLVGALQKAGHTVAMTGDGVNDVLALKDADCSVAMATGAQAAVGVAQVVLLESDFARMPDVVREGRRVVNNLERSGSLFIVKNLVSFSSAVLAILLGVAYPMIPAQVSFISLWAIGIPSFLLAQIPNERLIRGDFMKNILRVALPTAVTAVILLGVIGGLAMALGIEGRFIGTMSALVWVGVALIHLFWVARPYTKWSLGICGLCLAGVVVSVMVARPLFGLEEGLEWRGWAAIMGCLVVAVPMIWVGRKGVFGLFRGVVEEDVGD